MDIEMEFDMRADFVVVDGVAERMPAAEESLSVICDEMEHILKKISLAEHRLSTARWTRKKCVGAMLYQQLKTLKTIYNFHYQAAESKARQIIALRRNQCNDVVS